MKAIRGAAVAKSVGWPEEFVQDSASDLPETAEKILRGTRNPKGDLIGVHSAEVLDFAANALKTNPDRTIEAEVVKQYSDGTLSQVKKSTLAPISWDNAKIISATEEVGGRPAARVRVQDRATCHMGEIRWRKVDYDKR